MDFTGILYAFTLISLTVATDLHINTSESVAEVEPFFLSYTLDAYLLEAKPRWSLLNFYSAKLRTLASGLAPAILRFGGSPADHTIFAEDLDSQSHLQAAGTHSSVVVFTYEDLDNMVNFTRATGAKLLFDLNLQLRYGRDWDPTNAMHFMRYIEDHNYGDSIDFELGNEPDLFKDPAKYSTHQVGDDFVSMVKLIRSFDCLNSSRIVGPDVATLSKGKYYIKDVVEAAGKYMTAATFHSYYMNGRISKAKDLINPEKFDAYERLIHSTQKIVRSTSHAHLPVWNGETADAYGGGIVNMTDRFISGFLWLDKLGISARESVPVVIRQDLYGHNYGLLDADMNPNPDYWLSWLHKKLVGTRVLSVTTSGRPNTTRVYAHCMKEQDGVSTDGGVTLFALNVNTTASDTLRIPAQDSSDQKVYMYLMTAPNKDLLSKFVAVNGVILKMLDNTTLPTVKPLVQDVSAGVTLPPLSFGFFVLPNAQAKACM